MSYFENQPSKISAEYELGNEISETVANDRVHSDVIYTRRTSENSEPISFSKSLLYNGEQLYPGSQPSPERQLELENDNASHTDLSVTENKNIFYIYIFYNVPISSSTRRSAFLVSEFT